MRKFKALLILHGTNYFFYLLSITGVITLLFSWLIARAEMDGGLIFSLLVIISMLLTKLLANETYSVNSRQFAREMKYSNISSFSQIMFYSLVSYIVILWIGLVGTSVFIFYKASWSLIQNPYLLVSMIAFGNYMMSFLYILSTDTKRLISKIIKLIFMIVFIVLVLVVLFIIEGKLIMPLVLLIVAAIPTTYVLGYMLDKYDW